MEYLHVINIDKHNPNYKDRQNIWLRFHFSAMNDHGFSRLCEIDQMRFVTFIRLQIQTKKPVSLDLKYLTRQGMDFKARRLNSTIRQLTESELVTISEGTDKEQKPEPVDTKRLTTKSVTQSRVEKSIVDNNAPVCKSMSIFKYWNTKNIMNHKDSSKYLPSIKAALKIYTDNEIAEAIDNYKKVKEGPEFWLSKKWTLKEFIARGLEKCLTINKPFESYRHFHQPDQTKGNGVVL